MRTERMQIGTHLRPSGVMGCPLRHCDIPYSQLLKTTMVTGDPVDRVLEFYQDLLTRTPANDGKLGIGSNVGRSVIFSDESERRPFAFHTIIVNSTNSSTTLIITRGKDEDGTCITWKQYQTREIGN